PPGHRLLLLQSGNVVGPQQSNDIGPVSADELIEPVLPYVVGATDGHRDAECLRDGMLDARLDGHKVERDRLDRGEVSGEWTPDGRDVNVAPRDCSDDCRRRTVAP